MNLSAHYKIRITIIFLIFCFFYCAILFNLYLIQIKNHDFYAHLGEKQYNVTITQTPPRAPIYDRFGNYLALNKDSVSAFILPKSIEEPEKLREFLAHHFPSAYERLKENNDKYFMYIKRRLSSEQIELINQSAIKDIKLLNEPSRFYPVESAGQIIGINDIDNNGAFGIELQFNHRLAGSPSTFTLEKDARSGHFYFQKETKIKGQVGSAITLTIDSDLQFLAHEELKKTLAKFNAREGSVLIMDPTNGDILAMSNFPDFDPNASESITNIEYTKNKVITDVNELGSVIKICSALAALDAGVVTLDEPIDCENKLTTFFDHRRINTVSHTVAGIIPYAQVVSKSNNIGTAKVAKRLGTKIYDYYKKLGFGSKTGIVFPGEQPGFVNPPENWSKQSIISLSYGYEVAVSLLQLARAFSIIANNGFDVMPRLLLDASPPLRKERLFLQSSIDAVKEIMKMRHKNTEGYTLMSKTGTANIVVNGQYDPNKNRFTCVGILEKSDYKRVIVVFIREVVQKNLYAATVAAPLMEQLAKKLLIHDRKL